MKKDRLIFDNGKDCMVRKGKKEKDCMNRL
jgi:hypothetical protein